VRNAIDSAIRNDIYFVVDFHSHHIRLPEAVEFSQKVAKLYKGYNNVIYEIFNEPDESLYTWEDVRSYSVEVISKICEVDPNSLILVGSPDIDLDIDLVSEFSITGFSNVGYTVHFSAGTQRQELRDKVSDALVKGIPLFV
jgi:endoglucanase